MAGNDEMKPILASISGLLSAICSAHHAAGVTDDQETADLRVATRTHILLCEGDHAGTAICGMMKDTQEGAAAFWGPKDWSGLAAVFAHPIVLLPQYADSRGTMQNQ